MAVLQYGIKLEGMTIRSVPCNLISVVLEVVCLQKEQYVEKVSRIISAQNSESVPEIPMFLLVSTYTFCFSLCLPHVRGRERNLSKVVLEVGRALNSQHEVPQRREGQRYAKLKLKSFRFLLNTDQGFPTIHMLTFVQFVILMPQVQTPLPLHQ